MGENGFRGCRLAGCVHNTVRGRRFVCGLEAARGAPPRKHAEPCGNYVPRPGLPERWLPRWVRHLAGDERGGIFSILGLFIVLALLPVLVLFWDYGRVYVARQELETALDAAATAAASQVERWAKVSVQRNWERPFNRWGCTSSFSHWHPNWVQECTGSGRNRTCTWVDRGTSVSHCGSCGWIPDTDTRTDTVPNPRSPTYEDGDQLDNNGDDQEKLQDWYGPLVMNKGYDPIARAMWKLPCENCGDIPPIREYCAAYSDSYPDSSTSSSGVRYATGEWRIVSTSIASIQTWLEQGTAYRAAARRYYDLNTPRLMRIGAYETRPLDVRVIVDNQNTAQVVARASWYVRRALGPLVGWNGAEITQEAAAVVRQ